MKKMSRLITVCFLAVTLLLVTGTTAWAARKSGSPMSAYEYVQHHPNLAKYLVDNSQVDEQIMGLETGKALISQLVEVINGFGSGYVIKHPNLVKYLQYNPHVAVQITDYQGQSVNGSVYGESTGGSRSGHKPFSDVPSWAQQAVNAMSARGIVNGLGNGKFGSNQMLTRAQFAALIVREFGLLASTSASVYGAVTFADVPTSSWAYKDIEAAAPDMTYWTVDGENYFHPTAPADREDCMVAIVEGAGLANQSVDTSSVLAKFADAGSISPNLVNLVAIAVQSRLITGSQGKDGNWYLHPQATLTRAEGAVLLYRALNYSKVAPGGANLDAG